MNVIDYISEEVTRQGHNVTVKDGLERVGWMLDAWCSVLPRADVVFIDLTTIEELGKRVERVKNREGWRRCGVRVGSRICPPFYEVPVLLERLLSVRDGMTPIEFYKEFEMIHPFVDGNGRTGKILLNWMNGTLLDPIFPPADIFGTPIMNP
jgi:hypothetical protein